MWKVLLIGTACAVALAAVSVWIANNRFDRRGDDRIRVLLDQGIAIESSDVDGSYAPRMIAPEDLSGLPEPVRHWLETSGIIGQPMPRTVSLKQQGEIRLGPDRPWIPFHADQYYTIDPPAFLWRVSASAAPGLFIRGIDTLHDGRGRMTMILLALIKVVDASGASLDQGAAMRYLQEIVWFPAAALSESIVWTPIDPLTAEATLSLETIRVSGLFRFDEGGHVAGFEAMRYRDGVGMDWWQTPMGDYEMLSNVLVPTQGEGVWGQGEDAFPYIRIRLIDLRYDADAAYP